MLVKLLILSVLLLLVQSYKIVIFTPEISKSQVTFNKRVAETLLAAGHDVTMLLTSTFDGTDTSAVKIHKDIHIYRLNASIGMHASTLEKLHAETIFKDLSAWDPKMRESMNMFMGMLIGSCRKAVQNKEFLAWLENEKFDIAFSHMYHTCPIGLIHAAKIPTWIWMNSGMLMDYVANLVGAPTIPSYVPPMMMAAHDKLNFIERTKSVIGHALFKIMWPRMVPNAETAIFREELDPNFPELTELASNCPLVMVNSNDLYELPRPTLAKIINIGGLGIQRKDVAPLTGKFAEIAGKGKKMILMSFGSVAQAHFMPESWKTALLAAFGRHKDYEFLVRYEYNDLNDRLPPNVHLSKWLPQNDLLQHENTSAFISHGGYNSLQEVITAGKPLITIALFGDQPKNAKIAYKHGIAVNLEKSQITEDEVYEAIKEITENEKYSKNAVRFQKMVEKQPISAEQLLVRWTEFTAEFKTLENLVPAGQYLNFIQYNSIDVYLFLFSIVFTVIFVIFLILRFVYRKIKCCLGCNTKKDKKE